MRIRVLYRTVIAGLVVLAVAGCEDDAMAPDPLAPEQAVLARGGRPGAEAETVGNNLSYPVLWAEGVTKTLQGTAGMVPVLTGAWWYQWGTNGVDPDVTPASCPPDLDEGDLELNPDGLPLCDDGMPGSVDLALEAGKPVADNPMPLVRAYLQKDPANVWQAGSASVADTPLHVNWIDWGDNLESVDWYTRSQVRTEVVLFQDLGTPMLEYEMRHTSGWGIDEVHGAAASFEPAAVLGPGTRATVYSYCARLTIQKLLVEREDERLDDLVWVPGTGWTEPETDPDNPGEPYPDELVNDAIFNKPVHEGGDGPGYYSAEINVKGRIIYGYTWSVAKLHDDTPIDGEMRTAAGDYRITFSLDSTCGTVSVNTFLDQASIIVPIEEVIASETDTGGADGVLRGDLNLTYIDVRILERGGGGGGGNKGPRH